MAMAFTKEMTLRCLAKFHIENDQLAFLISPDCCLLFAVIHMSSDNELDDLDDAGIASLTVLYFLSIPHQT